ncbi:MAG: hypothetical protein OEL87_00085 [Nanoarchaeota archaeon]|nr:hypothetical protein [Nanoarchaeota archaeon]
MVIKRKSSIYTVRLNKMQEKIIEQMDINFSKWVHKKFDEEFCSLQSIENNILMKQQELQFLENQKREMLELNQTEKEITEKQKSIDLLKIKEKRERKIAEVERAITDFYNIKDKRQLRKSAIEFVDYYNKYKKENGKKPNFFQYFEDKGYKDIYDEKKSQEKKSSQNKEVEKIIDSISRIGMREEVEITKTENDIYDLVQKFNQHCNIRGWEVDTEGWVEILTQHIREGKLLVAPNN